MSPGPNPQTLTCRVFVHNLLDGKLNVKLSPNLGFDKSDIGLVQPLNGGFEPLGSRTIFTYLHKNRIFKYQLNILINNYYYLQLP